MSEEARLGHNVVTLAQFGEGGFPARRQIPPPEYVAQVQQMQGQAHQGQGQAPVQTENARGKKPQVGHGSAVSPSLDRSGGSGSGLHAMGLEVEVDDSVVSGTGSEAGHSVVSGVDSGRRRKRAGAGQIAATFEEQQQLERDLEQIRKMEEKESKKAQKNQSTLEHVADSAADDG